MRWIYNCLYEIISNRLKDKYDKGEKRTHFVYFNSDVSVMENEWGVDNFRPRIQLRSISYHVHCPNYYVLGVIDDDINTSRIQLDFPLEYFKSSYTKDVFIDKCIFELGKLLSNSLVGTFNKQIFAPTPVITFAYDDEFLKRDDTKRLKFDLEGIFQTEFVKIAAPGDYGIETKIILRFNLFPMTCPINVYYEFIPDNLIIE